MLTPSFIDPKFAPVMFVETVLITKLTETSHVELAVIFDVKI